MKWIEARHLVSWAERIDARIRLSEIVSKLVRASAASISAFRFPTGDSAQIPGYDGRLTAIPAEEYRAFLPEGDSVWEWGTGADYYAKAEHDYSNRTGSPGDAVDPMQTTFVFVTPQLWVRTDPSLDGWMIEKRAENRWKDVRALDAVQLEHWLELCPAVAASVAREIVGSLPLTGALSTEEFWREYCSQFQPTLREEVVLSGREEQAKSLVRALMGSGQVHRWQGDSLTEVLAFAIACIRKGYADTRTFLESRTLLVESKDAARQLADSPHLVFAVRGEAVEMAGRLAEGHPVIVPLGRESLLDAATTRLARPSTYEMAGALRTMGFNEDQAQRIARECDRSVTILGRRIPSAVANLPSWHNNRVLIPALLAGAWDSASLGDRAIVARLAGEPEYSRYEANLREFLRSEDAPLEREGTVWAVRAPVDVFVHLAPLLGTEHLNTLHQVATEVFGEVDPALGLGPGDRPFAHLRGAIRSHSSWLRDGLATTLLTIAALGDKSGVQFVGGSAQRLVNGIIHGIPGLRDDHRVVASLSNELPLLMEAAPDPLLAALEHLLRGDGLEMRQVFQDGLNQSTIFTHSPHTGLLWALEMIAWDPAYLGRAAAVLVKLVQVDPGGSFKNRPIESLRHIFLAWRPATNASLRQRVAVLDQILHQDPSVGWKLLVLLFPKRPDFGGDGLRPRFREAGASERQTLTDPLVLGTYHEVIERSMLQAGTLAERWAAILDELHSFPKNELPAVISQLEAVTQRMPADERASLWQVLNNVIRHHRAHPGADWSLKPVEIEQLEAVLKTVAPNDPIKESLWLFQRRSPEIPFTSAEKFEEEVEQIRRNAVARVWEARGVSGVIELASLAEAPGYVGFSLGHIVPGPEKAFEVASLAFVSKDALQNFVTLFSMALLGRFGSRWKDAVTAEYESGRLTAEQIIALVLAWPHSATTWVYVESLGADVAKEFWRSRLPWGLQGDRGEVEFAVEHYLVADRSEFVVEGLYPKMRDISSALILRTLDEFQDRIATAPNILRRQALDFELQQIFGILQDRTDIPLADVGRREYSYLPWLRQTYGGRDPYPSLILDRLMAEDAEFYVKILCDVFRPASAQSKESPVTEEQQARARFGWTLLNGFAKIPGFSAEPPEKGTLEAWVSEVRKRAAEKDRLVIAEQTIGKLLAHAPDDPGDSLWPHIVIRECLEDWQAEQIEQAVVIERFNMRGGGARDPKAGGKPEHDLATEIRQACRHLERWPRTQAMLLNLARMWEEVAEAGDLRARQQELRDA
ncbi:MAG: hypothetical protein ABR953_03880 [Candidatus Acidiferrales bacterium]